MEVADTTKTKTETQTTKPLPPGDLTWSTDPIHIGSGHGVQMYVCGRVLQNLILGNKLPQLFCDYKVMRAKAHVLYHMENYNREE